MPDVDAIVRFARQRSEVARVDLVGWSWGSLVAGMYAGVHGGSIRRLVLFAPLYDRKWPERHQTSKAWYPVKRETFYRYFDPAKEERAILDEVVESLFRFSEGDELRLPNGPYADLYGPASPIWDPKKVTVPVLVVRGDRDQASLDVHAGKLFADLVSSPIRRYVVIGGADHFAFRTMKHRELANVIVSFLREEL
jgi:pimeloyl-ACP methyl ester carboxylesterase